MADSLQFDKWDTAIIGPIVDDRGAAAGEFATKNSQCVHTLAYNPRALEIIFDQKPYVAEDVHKVIEAFASGRILLETTTLRFTEILLFLQGMKRLRFPNISMLYLEPEWYYRHRRDHVLDRRKFELSDEVDVFSGVPGSLMRLRQDQPTRTVFLVGYEGDRLEQALEQTSVKPSRCAVVFGVPAFRPGWEMDSFANNVNVIVERRIAANILFAAAQNPLSAYQSIEKVRRSCSAGERLLLVPIGTKPHAVGAALFACEHDDVGVIYDHPKRRQKRSRRIGSWHTYDVTLSLS